MTTPTTTPNPSHQEGNPPRVDDDQSKESCRACLITGVGTCTGLSGYFLYLAMEEEQKKNLLLQRAVRVFANSEEAFLLHLTSNRQNK
mmetsp:Transcript_45036/g.94449  ORF Transcript_45036/g.94449 Transcript_45036/m.94449 type:complete len:88 (-) Transcript_45036:167-430(-)